MSEEKFSGVDTLIERMGTHPEEFFRGNDALPNRGRWAFIYQDYFRDCMTEAEKGRIHEALKKVRRLEFDAMVVKELMKEEVVTEEQPAQKNVLMNPSRIAAIKQQVQSAPIFKTKLQQSFLKSQSDEVLGKKP